jgi:predicted nucleotidyltransferase component of viral defense system
MVFDRLLARLNAVAPDRWIVKGGVALELRLGDRARMTKDLDLARRDSEEAAAEDLVVAQSIDLGDFFTFTIDRTDALEQMGGAAAVRYRANAQLAGRRFENVIIDISFGSQPLRQPEKLRGVDLFAFAGLEPIEASVLPIEQHVAEKLHAYSRSYGDGRRSSRVKDLVDLVLIRSTTPVLASQLREAIDATFSERTVHDIPHRFVEPPTTWATRFTDLATEVGLDPDIDVGFRLTAAFLDPVLRGSVPGDARWSPMQGSWQPPVEEARGAVI